MILAGAAETTYEPCPPYAHCKRIVLPNGSLESSPEKKSLGSRRCAGSSGVLGEAVNIANCLLRMTPNNGLIKRDDRDGYKAPYDSPHEMLHAYGKPKRDAEGKDISYKAPTHHLRRLGCHASKLIPEAQRSSKFGPKSKLGCMMVRDMHDSTTTWRIWNPEFKKVNTQSERPLFPRAPRGAGNSDRPETFSCGRASFSEGLILARACIGVRLVHGWDPLSGRARLGLCDSSGHVRGRPPSRSSGASFHGALPPAAVLAYSSAFSLPSIP